MQLPPDDGSVKRVLDIGCGPGNSTAVLRERYPHAEILGVDSSQDMVEAARLIVQWALSSFANRDGARPYIDAAEHLFARAVDDAWNASCAARVSKIGRASCRERV